MNQIHDLPLAQKSIPTANPVQKTTKIATTIVNWLGIGIYHGVTALQPVWSPFSNTCSIHWHAKQGMQSNSHTEQGVIGLVLQKDGTRHTTPAWRRKKSVMFMLNFVWCHWRSRGTRSIRESPEREEGIAGELVIRKRVGIMRIQVDGPHKMTYDKRAFADTW